MRIVVAGGSGFLGQPLLRALRAAGHETTQLVRRPPSGPGQRQWNPEDPIRLPDDTGAVINLCGVSAAAQRWTDEYKNLILISRTHPTRTLADAVATQRIPIMVNASGITYYGDTGDDEADETYPAADGPFLAEVAKEWEAATAAASLAGARTVVLRTGLPMHRSGGFLKAQLLPFKMGVGGRLGSGKQWVPWISIVDWLGAVRFILDTDAVEGPVNMVGPKSVRNADFTKAFAAELHRPTLMPMIPKVAVQALYGGFADEAFRSIRAVPAVLVRAGFQFQHRTVSAALRSALTDDVPGTG